MFGNINPGGLEAILQVLGGLPGIIGKKEQRRLLLDQAMDKTVRARDELVIMQDDAVDITDHTSFAVQ